MNIERATEKDAGALTDLDLLAFGPPPRPDAFPKGHPGGDVLGGEEGG